MTNRVRLAGPADEDSLLHLLSLAHEEIGLFPYAADKVADLVHPVLRPNGRIPETPTVIGVCGPSNNLHASMCLMASQPYYSRFWMFRDLWCFVHPDHRRTTYHKDLLEWAKGVAERMHLSLISGVVSTERTEAKLRLYRRQFGQPVGGYYFMFQAPPYELDNPRREAEITA